MRGKTGENGRTGRTAHRLAGLGVLITNSLLSQVIKVRSFHFFVAVTTEHIGTGRVGHNENNLFFIVFHSNPLALVVFCLCDFAGVATFDKPHEAASNDDVNGGYHDKARAVFFALINDADFGKQYIDVDGGAD